MTILYTYPKLQGIKVKRLQEQWKNRKIMVLHLLEKIKLTFWQSSERGLLLWNEGIGSVIYIGYEFTWDNGAQLCIQLNGYTWPFFKAYQATITLYKQPVIRTTLYPRTTINERQLIMLHGTQNPSQNTVFPNLFTKRFEEQ